MKSKATSHSSKGSTSYGTISQVVTVILFVFFLWLIDRSISFYPVNSQSEALGTATLIFHFDEKPRTFEGEVLSGMTVLDALSASVQAGQINLVYSMRSDGTLQLDQVDGHAARESTFAFYLNGRRMNTDEIGRVAIGGGDRIEVRFE